MLQVLLLVATAGSGMVAGLIMAFSSSVVPGLSRIEDTAAISAMQSINAVIENPLFFAVFLGVPAFAAGLGIWAVFHRDQPGAFAMIAAALLLAVGVIGVTSVVEVPLNEMLAALDPAVPASAEQWSVFVRDWTWWNNVRLVTALLATAAFGYASRVAAYAPVSNG